VTQPPRWRRSHRSGPAAVLRPLPSLAARRRVWPPSLPRVCQPPFSSPLDPLRLTFSSLRPARATVDAWMPTSYAPALFPPQIHRSSLRRPPCASLSVLLSRDCACERVEQGLRRRREEQRPGGPCSVRTADRLRDERARARTTVESERPTPTPTGGSHVSGRTKIRGRNSPCFNIR
jgi:hypothetical protein